MNAELTKSTKQIYTGVLIIAIASVLLSITTLIMVTMSKGASASTALSLIATLGIILIVFGILSLVGYILYFMGVNKFKTLVNDNDKPAAKMLYQGVLLGLIGTLIAIIPLIGVVGGIIALVGSIFMIMAYNKMRSSSTMPEEAKKGWNLLFISALVLVCIFVVNFIPVVGSWLNVIGTIIAWVMMIMGWGKIKTHLV